MELHGFQSILLFIRLSMLFNGGGSKDMYNIIAEEEDGERSIGDEGRGMGGRITRRTEAIR